MNIIKKSHFLTASLSVMLAANTQAQQSPNIVFILADDMGWTGTSVLLDKNNDKSASD